MTRARILAAAGLVIASILLACSSDDRPGPDGSTTGAADIKALCARLADAFCGSDNPCKVNLVWQRPRMGDVATCTRRQAAQCELTYSARGVAISGAQAQACIRATDAGACPLGELLDGAPAAPECDFKGTLPDGKACGAHAQCLSGGCKRGGLQCGVCAPRVGEGGRCADGRCDAGLSCVSGSCKKRQPSGSHCNNDCEWGLVCTDWACYGRRCLYGSCRVPRAKGEPCDRTEGGDNCDHFAGLTCQPPNGTPPICQEHVWAKLNEPCGGEYPSCDAGLTCRGSCEANPVNGTCCVANVVEDAYEDPAACTDLLETAASVRFSDAEPTIGHVRGEVKIARATDESDVAHYALYWGQEGDRAPYDPVVQGAPIAVLPATGSDLGYPRDSVKPTGQDFLVGAGPWP